VSTSPEQQDRATINAEQYITAVDGFAYGVIGADVHVFGSGLPLYLLSEYQPAEPSDPGWLQDLPSRMLNARHEIVEFTGRDDELADLREWLDGRSRLAVRWFHGPGGQGKTRVAAKLAREATAAGWKAAMAVHGPGSVLPKVTRTDLRLVHAEGVLLIVDYADRWPLAHLTWLLSNRLLHQDKPARVLLLARSADIWPAVRAALANHRADTSTYLLGPLRHDYGERLEMFRVARDRFAEVYGLSNGKGIDPPTPLDDQDMGLTLAVHMAALVAVDAHATGAEPAGGMEGMTIYLLDRENLHWHQLFAEGAPRLGAGSPAVRTPPHRMNQVVFLAALTGAQDTDVAMDLIRRLQPDADPQQMLADHAVCYPSGFAGGALEPLYPDRLAEDFLALTLPGHAADYPAHGWARDYIRQLLQLDGESLPRWISRAVAFLVAAGQRWNHVGPAHLFPLLELDPRLLMAAGNDAMIAVARPNELEVAPRRVLEAVTAHLPAGRDTDFDTGISAITYSLSLLQAEESDDPVEIARHLMTALTRLLHAGHWQLAWSLASGCTDRYRELAEADESFLTELASALVPQSICHLKLGIRDLALATVAEAVEIYAADPTATATMNIVRALAQLSACLLANGDRADALRVARRAVDMAEADNERADSAPHAHALDSYGRAAHACRRYGAARDVMEQAAELWKRLAEAQPTVYLPELASCLSRCGDYQRTTGACTQAMASLADALALQQSLFDANIFAYRSDLAATLQSLAHLYLLGGRFDEALEAAYDASEHTRRIFLVTGNMREFGDTEATLALCLAEAGMDEEALKHADRAAAAWRDKVQSHQDRLALALAHSGLLMARLGRGKQAVARTKQAVSMARRLVKADAGQHEPVLAAALFHHGMCLAETGNVIRAGLCLAHSSALWQRLDERVPDVYANELASSLFESGMLAAGAPRLALPRLALPRLAAAVEIRRKQHRREPAFFQRVLAKYLADYSQVCSRSRPHYEQAARPNDS
jgi:tetratricopeptide (TPR) repeat protein